MRLFEFAQEHSLTESDSPVAGAITRRIIMQRSDLLQKYGPQKVMAAIDDVADFVGDTEEIGSSDVSGWIKQVEQTLASMGGEVDEADMSRRGFLKFGAAAALGAAGVGAATNAQAGANDTAFINKVQQQHFAMVEKNPRYAKEHADLNITMVRGMSGASAENNKQWAQKTAQLLQKYGVKVNEGVAEAGFPGAPDVEMPPMKPSGDLERDKLKQEYIDIHREIKSLVDIPYRSDSSPEQKMQAKARIKRLNDRADQIKAILEPRQPPNEWQKKTYGYDDNWNRVGKGVAEAGRYGSNNPDTMSPSNYDRYQQDQMDQGKRDFKRSEHEAEWEREQEYTKQLQAQDRGPWYIRIDGKIYRQGGQPKSFDWKKGANNYALAMVKNNPALQGKVMLSKSAEDK